MKQLEGFQYATKLYLNMEYYNIRLSLASKDTTAIVTKFRRFRYNRLPMGMCAPGDIFQARVEELLGDIKGIKAYINYIPVLSRDCF